MCGRRQPLSEKRKKREHDSEPRPDAHSHARRGAAMPSRALSPRSHPTSLDRFWRFDPELEGKRGSMSMS
jgi:hypothetical protein